MKIYTPCNINPCAAGFGEYERGEVQESPENSYALLAELENALDQSFQTLPIESALKDEDFIALGIRDIRGATHNRPSHFYAQIQEDAFGKRIAYIGVEESDVPENFFA